MPLVDQCAKREKQCQILHKEVTERTRNLKLLFAMIRSPNLCDMVYKTERRRYSKEKLKELREESINNLRMYKFSE